MQKFIKGCQETDISDVDFYIMQYNQDKQERLVKIRSAEKEKHPGATERIYYGIPTVEKDGKIILQYAAYKNHVSLLVGNVLPAVLKENIRSTIIRTTQWYFLTRNRSRRILSKRFAKQEWTKGVDTGYV